MTKRSDREYVGFGNLLILWINRLLWFFLFLLTTGVVFVELGLRWQDYWWYSGFAVPLIAFAIIRRRVLNNRGINPEVLSEERRIFRMFASFNFEVLVWAALAILFIGTFASLGGGGWVEVEFYVKGAAYIGGVLFFGRVVWELIWRRWK